MKRLAIAALLAALAVLTAGMTINRTPDKKQDNQNLKALWRDYEAAVAADRPARQAEVLSRIKELARRERLNWDFYDAGRKYVQVEASRNWKLSDSLRRVFKKEIDDYAEPVVWVAYRREFGGDRNMLDLIQQYADRLQSGADPEFWKDDFRVQGQMNGVLTEFIRDNYEYALWTAMGRNTRNAATCKLLEEYLKGRYPAASWLDYLKALSLSEKEGRRAALEALAEREKGKATALFPQAELLQEDFRQLERDGARSAAYQAFLERCKAFEAERKAFSGSERRIAASCGQVDGLISTMQAPSLSGSVYDGKIRAYVRNLSSVDVKVYQEDSSKPLFTATLTNPRRSFYAQDTLEVALPKLDDGSYQVKYHSGKEETLSWYRHFRLSLARQQVEGGTAVYVADAKSGKPVSRADMVLLKNGKEVARAGDTSLGDRFTRLPITLASKLAADREHYSLKACFRETDGTLCSSEELYLGETADRSEEARDGKYANLYTDRSAYRPGDTVQFKAVFFEADLQRWARTIPEGKKGKAWLQDSEGKQVAEQAIRTNGFGSAAGSFRIPEGLRGGSFSLEVECGEHRTATQIRVDEFVLPTFDLTFDPVDRLYAPGDSVEVRGTLTSYSGHSLAGAELAYRVTRGQNLVQEGKVSPQADGRFAFAFASLPNQNWCLYSIQVNVLDGTGETQAFHTSVNVNRDPTLTAILEGFADAQASRMDTIVRTSRRMPHPSLSVLDKDTLRVTFRFISIDLTQADIPVAWQLKDEKGKLCKAGSALVGTPLDISMEGLADGLYFLDASDRYHHPFLLLRPQAAVLDAPIDRFFQCSGTKVPAGGKFSVRVGSADGPVWAVVQLFGQNRRLLQTRAIHLTGERGKPGSLVTLEYPYPEDYPDAIHMNVFYFKDYEAASFGRDVRRIREKTVLPLSFSSFEDRTFPATRYTFGIRSLPGVECLAAVFDKSTERIARVEWPVLTLQDIPAPWVEISSVTGSAPQTEDDNVVLIGYSGGARTDRMVRGMAVKSANVLMKVESAAMAPEADEVTEEVSVRSDFSSTLAFEPFLRTDAEGKAELNFRTSDKLSTYVVALYAHNPQMQNALLRREMVVTLPVKVAVAEPQALRVGDRWSVAATVSSVAEVPVSGTLYFYDAAAEGSSSQKNAHRSASATAGKKVTVPAGGSITQMVEVAVPERPGTLEVKVVFEADPVAGQPTFSDGVKVGVPVLPAVQTLTEAHSAVLLPGMDKEALLAQIRSQFVNVSSMGAEYREISILDMIREALPDKVEPRSENILDLLEALYVRKTLAALVPGPVPEEVRGAYPQCPCDEEPSGTGRVKEGESQKMSDEILEEKIGACQNEDGGFGWFQGMQSSPILTAVVLEWLARMPEPSGFAAFVQAMVCENAVKFLDDNQFNLARPFWCGGISDEQYLYIRSMYAEAPFAVNVTGSQADYNKRMKEFRKWAKVYLVPERERGLNGHILDKACRVLTLRNLLASPEGIALAKTFGVSFGAKARMEASVEADIASLLEYAVPHKDGGMYYPNAVMPFRGLLESEAYAHALLCRLFSSGPGSTDATRQVADGIRIWLMLQKETQQWDETPGFVDAIAAVLAGSEEVKATRVILMERTYEKPYADIRPAGNGFSVERTFQRSVTVAGKVKWEDLQPGEVLAKGETIRCEYRIWNGENRSFVRLTAPREATLRPVKQLSGMYGWGIRPLWVNGWFSFQPRGYREVKADRSIWWFDSYPEEKTTIAEEFFVTQTGVFTAPVVEMESLYAPHYRANAGFEAAVTAR